ncbi:MAG: hypothetical protein JNK21_02950, partial [Rhodospirillaceae bacterium]|nr:hypothetical protein [Rhodospirillaceae bacterium]
MMRASAFANILRATGLVSVALLLGASVLSQPAWADGVRAAQRDNYGRIVFDWNDPVRYSAAVVGGQLVVQFERPISGDLAGVQQALGPYVLSGFLSADGRTATFPLRANVTMRTFTVGNAVVIDLSSDTQQQAAAQTQAPAQAPAQTPAPPATAPAGQPPRAQQPWVPRA